MLSTHTRLTLDDPIMPVEMPNELITLPRYLTLEDKSDGVRERVDCGDGLLDIELAGSLVCRKGRYLAGWGVPDAAKSLVRQKGQ